MNRYYNERDRDEQGRFTSDDGRDNRRDQGGGYRSRGQHEGNDWRGSDYGDDRSSSHSPSRYEDDDRRSSRSPSHYEDEDRRSSRGPSRYEDDDRRYGNPSSQGGGQGWHGDPEGHSEASRRGWSHRDEDDRGSRGSMSQRGDDRRNSSRDDAPEHDHGGWYGDRRGHADAARRGWENRR